MIERILEGVPVLRLESCDPKKTGLVLAAYLPARALRRAATRLLDKEYHIEDVCALDTADGYVAVYHFDHYESPGRVCLKVIVDKGDPRIPSISDIFSGASWHERETHDFTGLVFEGLENDTPLLLPADADFHPLQKEAKALKKAADLVEPGTVLYEDPGFALFAAPETGKAPEKEEKA